MGKTAASSRLKSSQRTCRDEERRTRRAATEGERAKAIVLVFLFLLFSSPSEKKRKRKSERVLKNEVFFPTVFFFFFDSRKKKKDRAPLSLLQSSTQKKPSEKTKNKAKTMPGPPPQRPGGSFRARALVRSLGAPRVPLLPNRRASIKPSSSATPTSSPPSTSSRGGRLGSSFSSSLAGGRFSGLSGPVGTFATGAALGGLALGAGVVR